MSLSERARRLNDLLRKIETSIGKARVTDVTDVAASMVILGAMQMYDTKEGALAYVGVVHQRMANIIEADFDDYKLEQRNTDRGLN
jgi:hypothetical protein